MSTESKVVGLRGQAVIDKRKPNQDVVDICEKLLEQARSGEITGVIIVKHYFDEAGGLNKAGYLSYSSVGQLQRASKLLLDELE
jgi:hypothetical protein